MPARRPSAAAPPFSSTLLDEGIQLAQQGERERARIMLQRVIHATPEAEEAWLWLAWLADERTERSRLLAEAKQLFPDSPRVAEALAAFQEAVPAAAAPEPASAPKKRKPKQPRAAKPVRQPRTARQRPAAAPLNWHWPAYGLLAAALAAVMLVVWLSGGFSIQRPVAVQALDLPTPETSASAAAETAAPLADLLSQAEVHAAAQDWEGTITLLDAAREIAPRDERARLMLATAYYGRGLQRIHANDLDTAQTDLDEAIRLDASNMEVHEARRSLSMYLDGVRAYQLQNWEEVVRCLSKVLKIGAGYRDTEPMLAQGYLGVARLKQADENWYDARQALDKAVQLQPDFPEAQQVMIEVNEAITPARRVEVHLSEHLVKVYEQHQVIRTFPMCDGKKGSPTRAGRFPVLDKEPMALASQWGGLQMPWWIGLYYTNDDVEHGIENGFHALPYRADQQVMWSNSLGGPCSYGCIVLDTEDARWLYDWVSEGTIVFILE